MKWGEAKLIAYEATLSNAQNVALIRAAQKIIEAVGGRVKIEPPTKAGMVVVVLHLPADQRPQDYFPTIPFYPV